MAIRTDRDAAAYVLRALMWAQVDLTKIDAQLLPDILETYDNHIEPITVPEVEIVVALCIRWADYTIAHQQTL